MKKLKFQTLKDEGNAKFNEEYEYFEENYLHGNSLINIKHIRCGTIFEITGLRHLRSKYGGCPICRIIGERNPIWNPDREEVALRRKTRAKFGKMLRRFLKVANINKTSKSAVILGYNAEDLKNHIINHPNYKNCDKERWQIDHIFPIQAFINHGINNPKIINSLDNLQPINGKDNSSKRDKYDEKEFLKYIDAKFEKYDVKDLIKSYEEIMAQFFIPSSIYTGIVKTTQNKTWRVNFRIKGKVHYIGSFYNEKEAAKNYDYFHLKYKGCAINFPDFDFSNFIPIKNEITTDNH